MDYDKWKLETPEEEEREEKCYYCGESCKGMYCDKNCKNADN